MRLKGHAFICVLPQSDVWFIRVYPKENLESFLDGHVQAFRLFGMTPQRMLYDNAGYVVKPQGKPLTGRDRNLSTGFLELKSAFLFEVLIPLESVQVSDGKRSDFEMPSAFRNVDIWILL